MTSDAGQLLLVGIPGKEIDADTAAMLRRVQPGGFILFGRNIGSPEQLRKLIDDLRDISSVEPVITIDQEGGRVSRLRLIGEEPPNAQQLRDKGDPALVRRHGELTAKLLRLFGFNLDLCPVLDISFDDEADNSLRGRCYGRTAEQVIALAGEFNDALRGGGVLSCGKHFPGYTMAGEDPHHGFPVIARDREVMEANELAVFRHFASSVDSMMIGHIHYACLDGEVRPASLSPAIINSLLREDMGFDGLIMTDDLDMGAILNTVSFEDMLALGLAAGNDLLMICHRVDLLADARAVLEKQPAALLDAALERVACFKQRMSPPTVFSPAEFQTINRDIWDLRVAVLGEERAWEKSVEDGKRSPVELY
ncbi:MAG: glycoside hydrolase family 3 protein [Chthoniobacterales bacterium]|nr:glycoside hydrolase family 3 protein [Chthoniobacterales bacterium]